MATHKSAEKRHRQSLKKKAINKQRRSELKTTVKSVRTAKDKETAEKELKKAIASLDRMASKKIIHKNKAANQKSKLTRLVNKPF
ncbi:MAG: 30S ribosomal protein S20 [Bacteroidetes bacterium]|nr:30S ribosomal protein S20 [Bacteroidota bacterium]MBU2584757.1 30S ribosomal protein S20 [Bacteroidota bacterium]